MLSQTEENYLKVLFIISSNKLGKFEAGTNELAAKLGVKPATANDMLKKLKEKELVSYEKYGKIFLTDKGKKLAIEIVRKHRLWETFLYDKLEFKWDEVHDIAEQLEHVNSVQLIEKLDKFLGHPKFDPHGDPIPNAKGDILIENRITLSKIIVGQNCTMVGVKDNTNSFLQCVMKLGLKINCNIKVVEKEVYDASMQIEVNETVYTVSEKITENIFVV